MARFVLIERRNFHAAAIERNGAARVKTAAGRRIHGRRDIAHQDNPFTAPFDARIGNRNGGKQRLRVRVQRIFVERIAIGQLHELADIHDGDSGRDVPHDREIVRDEEIRQAEFGLQIFEQS